MDILAISPQVLHDELVQVETLVHKWVEALDKGVPGVETPTSDESALIRFLTEFGGEMLLVAGKCETLSNIVSERSVSDG